MKNRPYEDRVLDLCEQIEILENKRTRLCAQWLAKEAKKHDGLAARGRVLSAQVDAGMSDQAAGTVREIVTMAAKRGIRLPDQALRFLLTDEELGAADAAFRVYTPGGHVDPPTE